MTNISLNEISKEPVPNPTLYVEGDAGISGKLTVGDLSDDIIDTVWEKMFERPAIIQCEYCLTHNVFTDPSCRRCGAPFAAQERMMR